MGMPGQPPIILGAPMQKKTHPVLWTLAVVAVVLFGLYEIGIHQPGPNPPAPTPTNPTNPATPTPGPQTPPTGGGGSEASLVAAQTFAGQVGEADGQVQISNGKWTNNATVAITSSNLQCVQSSASGTTLTQSQTTLTGPSGPLQPQTSTTFDPFKVGAVAQGAAKASCSITSVVPAS
jgi:hypothetical protein